MPKARAITRDELTPQQQEEVTDCGPDARNHPLELADGKLRFKANAALHYLHRTRQLDLNKLTEALDMSVEDHRLGLREFYRHLGYSLNSYLELFWDQLQEEKEGAPRA